MELSGQECFLGSVLVGGQFHQLLSIYDYLLLFIDFFYSVLYNVLQLRNLNFLPESFKKG